MALDPLLVATFTLLLITIFASAALGKLRALPEFEGVVANYQLLPQATAKPIAVALPLFELVVAILLLFPTTRAIGGVAAAMLLILFSGAMGLNIIRGRRSIDCGCFRTTHRQYLTGWHLLRNWALTLFALSLAMPVVSRDLGAADIVQAALGAGALYTIYLGISTVFVPRPPTYDENFAASTMTVGEGAGSQPFVLPQQKELAQ